jgi:hypothetical protein
MQEALLLIETQGPLRNAGSLGDLTYLEIRFIGIRHGPRLLGIP